MAIGIYDIKESLIISNQDLQANSSAAEEQIC